MSIEERREERRRLEHAHRQAARTAAMSDSAAEHGPRIAALTDWRAVMTQHSDVQRRLRRADADSVDYEQLCYLDRELGQRRYDLWIEEVERLNGSDCADGLRTRWAAASRADLDRRGSQLGAKAKNRGCGLSPVGERGQGVREADVRALPPDAPQRSILRSGRSRDHP